MNPIKTLDSFCRTLQFVYSDGISEIYADLIKAQLKSENLEHLLKGKIVDLGCGSGKILHLFQHMYGCEVVGVDIEPTCMYPNVKYLQEEMCYTSITSETATVVVAVNIGDFFGLDLRPEEVFQEIDRILIVGGVFLPTTAHEQFSDICESRNYKKFNWGYQKQKQ